MKASDSFVSSSVDQGCVWGGRGGGHHPPFNATQKIKVVISATVPVALLKEVLYNLNEYASEFHI